MLIGMTEFILLLLVAVAVILGIFAIVSVREGEKRATLVSLLGMLGAYALFLLGAYVFVDYRIYNVIAVILGISAGLFLILFLLPMGKRYAPSGRPKHRVDERDIMFARGRLKPGSPEYESYYQMRPENQTKDDRTRAKPGLLSPKSKLANTYHFASAEASFAFTGALREAVNGPVADRTVSVSPEKWTRFVKDLAKYYGALTVGVAPLKDYHVYSHIGRGTGEYGAPIDVKHPFAVAFTTEMDFHMLACSPQPPVVMESARQYVETAKVGVQLAAALRNLGFNARAHIDGNYRVIAPLVAKDAGLGEIGRMGLLMTPELGPRVRIGVVTTDATLVPDTPSDDVSVIDFCTICKKCAENCPSKSISIEDRFEDEGCHRWKIDCDTCFRYWNVIGTDCGRCVSVCPYAHPKTFFHNLTRWGVARSGFFRRLALWADDLFYGRKPSDKDLPKWTQMP